MQHYTFDWLQSPGDTIKEKWEHLLVMIQGIIGRIGGVSVVTSPEVASVIETVDGDFMPCVDCHMGSLYFVGMGRYHASQRFELFKASTMRRNDIVIFGQEDNATLIIKNDPVMEESWDQEP